MHQNSDEERAFRRALELDEAERTIEAIREIEPLVVVRDNPRFLFAYAMFLHRTYQLKEAIAALSDALNIKPTYCEGEMRLFLADLLLNTGAKKDAIDQWRLVAEMKPTATGYGAVPDEAIVRLKQHDV